MVINMGLGTKPAMKPQTWLVLRAIAVWFLKL